MFCVVICGIGLSHVCYYCVTKPMKPVIHYMIGPTGSSAISYTDKRTTDFRSAEKSYYGRYGTDFLLSRLDLSVESIGMQILNQGFRQFA